MRISNKERRCGIKNEHDNSPYKPAKLPRSSPSGINGVTCHSGEEVADKETP